ncbi:MAG TPA: esterase-like activity of phytase family protein [Jatrophihabitans sp.]|nr:esterase-like activity of phytase family protein [Jatrophihabitans sp.]
MATRARRWTRIGAAVGLLAGAAVGATAGAAASSAAPGGFEAKRACPPAAVANGFSDALDKLVYNGVTLGGLSSLAFDRRSNAWVSAVDNHGSDPARIWFFRGLSDPTVVRDPLVLRRPDGTPYDGTTSDNEGLAVLPDGNYLVSSETEPSIRIFGRDGVQLASLPIPARFGVTGTTPEGEATANATLEGLTITPSGDRIIAAMEGALSGDVSASGDATYHRFLVYTDRHGAWRLEKQVAYRAEPGMRIPEVAAYREGSLLVEEAAFSPPIGNTVDLYAVTGVKHAPDVSDIANLSDAPASDVLGKRLVANLVACPTLDAPSKETQTNPLLDNFEGMAITGAHASGRTGVTLISDDNFSATQTTRLLNLAAYLP